MASALTSRRPCIRVVDAAVEKAYGKQAPHPLDGGLLRARRPTRATGSVSRRNAARLARVRRVDQGAARHADRRWHPLAQRSHAAESRPVRLRASHPLLPGRVEPDAGREPHRHGDLPREHGGHLRGYRVGGGHGGSSQAHRVLAERPQGYRHPLPGELRHRHQAGLERGQPASDPQGDPVRDRYGSDLGDAGPQGQHHEVHGRRLP